MKGVFYCIFLVVAGLCATNFRLDTTGISRLNVGDSIISTLGHFRATLTKPNCSLQVHSFNQTQKKYESKGKLTISNRVNECEYMQIIDGMLRTNDNITMAQVLAVSYNDSTVFTIDDQGVFRLISTYVKPNIVDLVSTQLNFTEFQTTPKFLRAVSQLQVQFTDTFEAVENNRKWQFVAEFGQLTIFFSENPQFKTDYVYSSINIRDTQIFDFADETFPGTLYNNITFHPRCFGPRIYLDYKPPYTFVIDQFWPIFSVYEQGGYKILQIAYSDLPQYDFQQNIPTYHFYRTYSPCPSRTFQLEGDCVAICPQPYYHEMRGQAGKCVLTCQQFTPLDSAKRTCSCFTEYQGEKMNLQRIKNCPSSAKQSPYGCYCEGNLFYDGKYTFDCVSSCPSETFARNGLCMECPAQCLSCSLDSYNRNLLECKQCKEGYKVHIGQCVKDCVNNHGLSISTSDVCIACTNKNCVDCSENKDICKKCDILTTLTNNTCENACNQTSTSVYSELFDTVCLVHSTQLCTKRISTHYLGKNFLKCDQCSIDNFLKHKDECVDTCPQNYTAFNDSYCVCAGENMLTIGDQCVEGKACPITMFFDSKSHSCLSCPFGCMSCINRQCTSCNPGYYLYISPQIILCRRKSPLFPCDRQYQLIRQTCVVKQFNNANLRMRECLGTVPNCRVCIPRSTVNCVMCDDGFLLYNNTCLDQCPQGLSRYQDSCIIEEIVNCQIHHLYSNHQSIVINYKSIDESTAYDYYTYFGRQAANDPIGFIPYFQQLTTQKNDGIPRQTDFFDPSWICHKCRDGYGLTLDKTGCKPCPQPCITCYYAQSYSCLSKRSTFIDDCGYIDTVTRECVGNCTDETKFPQMQNGILYCKSLLESSTKDYIRIDSAIYPFKNRNGSFVFFVFGDKLSNLTTQDLVVDQQKVQNSLQSSRSPIPLQANQEEVGSEYVKIVNASSQYYYLNFTNKLGSFSSENNLLFPNTIYGTYGTDLTHIDWMKTWLAYIGYLMSIVVIILHAVFIGNELIYKVDNVLIFVQTIFYFIYAKNLVGRLLAQFYWGWSFSHARFLPNFFQEQNYIPDGYIEDAAPVSYKLVNIDGNFFRNAGFSLTWMIILIVFVSLVSFILWTISNLAHKREAWNFQIAKQIIIGIFQFFSFNIIFFSITQVHFSDGAQQYDQGYFQRSQALAIVCLFVFIVYTIARFFFNLIGALYMVKRFLLAAILMSAYNQYIFILPAIVLEIVFFFARYAIEKPDSKNQRISIIVETILIIGAYLLMFLVLDAGVNTIIISIIVFFFIVALAYDLTTVYLESKHEYREEQVDTDVDSIVRATRVRSQREYMRNVPSSSEQG